MPTEVLSIKREGGVAGQYALVASVQYENEAPDEVSFVGSIYGGPVVMVLSSGTQTFVHDPGRFGEFGEQWVRNFFEGG